MKTTMTLTYVSVGLLGAFSFLVPCRALGQAGPGPLSHPQAQPGQAPQAAPAAQPQKPQVPPRTTLAGAWRLNHDQSDDPRQRVRIAEGAPNGYPGGGYPGGGNPGGGYPGGGYPRGPWGGSPFPGGGGGGPTGGPGYGGRDIEDNPRIQPLLRPAESMTIDVKSSEVEVDPQQYHKLIFYTDGRQLKKSSDDNREEIPAHWEGNKLVSDERGPLGGKMTRTFELAYDGRQLFENLHIDNGRGTPISIRYVYDIPLPGIQNREDSDPDRPVLKRHSDDKSSQ